MRNVYRASESSFRSRPEREPLASHVVSRAGPPPQASQAPSRLRDWIATIPIVLLVPALLFVYVPATASGIVRYVSIAGSDSNPGTIDQPWRTVRKGIASIYAGDILYVRGGTYVENVTGITLNKGTAANRITVAAYPGERPVIQGLLWLGSADYWTIDGINVTWNSANTSTQHMVKFQEGTGWILQNAELWGARSFAALLVGGRVAGTPSNWVIRRNCIHDTVPSNGTHQDHNAYIDNGVAGGPGVIEGNLFFNAPNGENVKLGGPSSTTGGAANVLVRYNTMYNGANPVAISYLSHDNRIERNVLVKAGTGRSTVYGYELTGAGNVALDNLAFDAGSFLQNTAGDQAVADGGGNLFPLDPLFTSVQGCSGFHTTNAVAEPYGRYADVAGANTTPEPIATTTPVSTEAPVATATPGGAEPAPTAASTEAPMLTAAPLPTEAAQPQTSPSPTPVPSMALPPGTPPGITLASARAFAAGRVDVLSIERPLDAENGDLLIVSLDVLGRPRITPPAGWRLAREDAQSRALMKATYVHVAGPEEETAYLWKFEDVVFVNATVAVVRGAAGANAVADSSGRTSPNTTSITAPSATATDRNTMVMGFYVIATKAAVAPPAGMVEASEASTEVSSELAFALQTLSGETGKKVATASAAGRAIGQLLVLRPGP